ncbi:MAG: hypothetical protein FJW39_16435 [Acidobacteria bacterium]|nr:hypothetical protein [Acidobacteriota bacterium]
MLTVIKVDEKAVAATVAELERRFAPDVVRIRYTLKNDWSGDPAIYFRVLLTDDAAREERLYTVAGAIRKVIWWEVDTLKNWDVMSYISFRSVSEQKQMRDAEWD